MHKSLLIRHLVKALSNETKERSYFLRKISARRILRLSAADIAKLGLYKFLMTGGREIASLSATEKIPDDAELFCLSEIKKTDKSIEIKSVDRIKAAALLIELARIESESSGDSESFLKSFRAACDDLNRKADAADSADYE